MGLVHNGIGIVCTKSPPPPLTPPPDPPPTSPLPTSPPYLRLALLDRRLASLDARASPRTPLR